MLDFGSLDKRTKVFSKLTQSKIRLHFTFNPNPNQKITESIVAFSKEDKNALADENALAIKTLKKVYVFFMANYV